MKLKSHVILACAALCIPAHAGSESTSVTSQPVTHTDGFAHALRPITNPTGFDLALPRTSINAIAMYQKMPDRASIVGGGSVPLGGDFQVYALQAEYALNDRLSIIASKDGYVDFNPESTLSHGHGFANLAAGVKGVLISDEAKGYLLSGIATIELPTGEAEVYQGSGDGSCDLALANLLINGDWQFGSNVGVKLPFDTDASSTQSFVNLQLSRTITPWFSPTLELHWFHVLSEGDGSSSGLASVVGFEGGDLLNWGAKHGGDNGDIVTAALGFHSQLNHATDLGLAYEIPLTESEDNLMDHRITLSVNVTF